MAAKALKYPFCGSENLRSYGASNGKKRYACNNPSCSHKTFYAECRYNVCKPDVKKAIIKWAADGTGIRAIARELGISADTVIKELKKKEDKIEYVNKDCLKSHKNVTINMEMDEMWSFFHGKKRQI
ncbi:MAG: helix-turn-helix domain-containing protein [Treponema sp.]|nr:helix-turn-helix domain-containing protein [Treponema sp.]